MLLLAASNCPRREFVRLLVVHWPKRMKSKEPRGLVDRYDDRLGFSFVVENIVKFARRDSSFSTPIRGSNGRRLRVFAFAGEFLSGTGFAGRVYFLVFRGDFSKIFIFLDGKRGFKAKTSTSRRNRRREIEKGRERKGIRDFAFVRGFSFYFEARTRRQLRGK